MSESTVSEKMSRQLSNLANSQATTQACCTAWDKIQKNNGNPNWRDGVIAPAQQSNKENKPK